MESGEWRKEEPHGLRRLLRWLTPGGDAGI
jgi:hypothetical protein